MNTVKRLLRSLSVLLVWIATHGCSSFTNEACERGQAGCPCFRDARCATNGAGVRLVCDEGLCVCPPGEAQCPCTEDGACSDNPAGVALVCDQGICGCPSGSEGCSCAQDGTCQDNAAGVALACIDGACVCTPGSEGCACDDGACGDSATGAALSCVDGTCQCPPGLEGCACSDGSCAAGLLCTDAMGAPSCQPRTLCPPGTLGCACYDDESCDSDHDGAALRCSDGQCVLDACERGEPGCACLSGRRCASDYVCEAGLCVEDSGQSVQPPAEPRCYTPCRGSATLTDGSILECSGEGLVEGCIGDATCVNGSCLTPAELELGAAQSTACRYDAACPDFQTCIDGHCYSDCEIDADCRSGRECFRKVCRAPCQGGNERCPADEYCQTLDGDTGYCFPLGIPRSQRGESSGAGSLMSFQLGVSAAVTSPADRARIRVEAAKTRFTPADPAGHFVIVNESPRDVQIRVSKLEHTVFPESGPEVVSDAPLSWVGLELTVVGAAGQRRAVNASSEARVPEGGTLEVTIDGTDPTAPRQGNPAAATDDVARRWSGKLKVETADGFETTLALSFAREPSGRFTGSIYYFGHFPDRGLDEWMQDRNSSAQHVGNALIQRWAAFRQGSITLDEFRGVLRAVENESWKDPLVRQRCPDPSRAPDANWACYPFNNDVGVGHLSDSLDTVPVPSGVIELPASINLRADPSDPAGTRYEGRIASSETLHYGGDPRVELLFDSAPTDCSTAGDASCLHRITHLNADVWTGARRPTLPEGGCPPGLELVREPWLVPLFDAGTELDPTDGQRFRASCRDPQLPFADAAREAANLSLAGANPVPDGRRMRRRIELVDGAMIDQGVLFVLFRENIPSFLDPSLEDRGYGYLLLRLGETELSEADFRSGRVPPDPDALASPVPAGPACSTELIHDVFGVAGLTADELSSDQRRQLARAMVSGVVPPAEGERIPESEEADRVHYLCAQTDTFDDGAACPTESEVIYFSFSGSGAPTDLDRLPCQRDDTCRAEDPCSQPRCGPPCETKDCQVLPNSECAGGCSDDQVCLAPPCRVNEANCDDKRAEGACLHQLQRWAEERAFGILMDPACRCSGTEAACSSECGADRTDLRTERDFFERPGTDILTAAKQQSRQEHVHYLCHETGHLDTGPDGLESCPRTSRVDFFVLDQGDSFTRNHACQTTPGVCREGEQCAQVAVGPDGTQTERLCEPGRPCSHKGSCAEAVSQWRSTGAHHFNDVTGWQCADPSRIDCTFADPADPDLRQNKAFFAPANQTVALDSIESAIQSAFRYKRRFQNRAGTNIGFAPDACLPGTNAIPYCYDAEAVQRVRERVDCALEIYTRHPDELSDADRAVLQPFLQRTFSYSEDWLPGLPTPVIRDGFEQLYAELLVMLGDEAVTRAFSSRFDLAGLSLADFPGASLEPDGLELSGKAGFELYSLYQGIQYYQLVLDRFFGHTKALSFSLLERPALSFLGQRSAVSYVPRVIGASTKKARAAAEIAKRYVSFNRPDLARHVIERSYVSSYTESIIMLEVLDRVSRTLSGAEQAQLAMEKERAQLIYSAALRSMRATYDTISDEPTFFGLPESLVPVPPVDVTDINVLQENIFDVALSRAEDKLAIAGESERAALESKREFDTDRERFINEMAELKRTYENELAAVCGSFAGDNGGIFAAIPRNAAESDRTRAIGNPCGLVGNGAISDAVLELEQSQLAVEQIRKRMDNLNQDIEGLNGRMQAQCGRIKALADWRVREQDRIITFNQIRRGAEIALNRIEGVVEKIKEVKSSTECLVIAGLSAGTDCPQKAAGLMTYLAAVVPLEALALSSEIVQAEQERKIEGVERDIAERELLEECTALQIDTKFDIRAKLRELAEVELEAAQLALQVQRDVAQVRALYNDAQSAMDNRAEAEQLRINVEVAMNDPNIRILKSEAIITADRHFFAALREAWKATRIFEYFTSQTFARRGDLLLIRLAAVGERSLQDYLIDLRDAFNEFEVDFGQPDMRLAILSMRDDLVPRLQGNTAMTDAERKTAFREALSDLTLRDPSGNLTIPFGTELGLTSPLTANHKILFMEAELVGTELGDDLGRLTLRQTGTGTIRGLDGDNQFFVLPPRTAVLNTLFNGQRNGLERGLFRSQRMRDRPLVNTGWELVFDQRQEAVNRDIDLGGLKDIVLYLYYTDFTLQPEAL